jgi:hypothetical protein
MGKCSNYHNLRSGSSELGLTLRERDPPLGTADVEHIVP